jgi:hypothetical protein
MIRKLRSERLANVWLSQDVLPDLLDPEFMLIR